MKGTQSAASVELTYSTEAFMIGATIKRVSRLFHRAGLICFIGDAYDNLTNV